MHPASTPTPALKRVVGAALILKLHEVGKPLPSVPKVHGVGLVVTLIPLLSLALVRALSCTLLELDVLLPKTKV